MVRALYVVGIVGVIAAFLNGLVLARLGQLLGPIVGLVAVVLFMINARASRWAIAFAGLIALFSILAMLGTLGNISTRSGSLDFGVSQAWGVVFAVWAGLLAGAGALAVRPAGPSWAPLAAWIVAGLAALLAVLERDFLVNQSRGLTLILGLLCLLLIVPLAMALRAPAPIRAAAPTRTVPPKRR